MITVLNDESNNVAQKLEPGTLIKTKPDNEYELIIFTRGNYHAVSLFNGTCQYGGYQTPEELKKEILLLNSFEIISGKELTIQVD